MWTCAQAWMCERAHTACGYKDVYFIPGKGRRIERGWRGHQDPGCEGCRSSQCGDCQPRNVKVASSPVSPFSTWPLGFTYTPANRNFLKHNFGNSAPLFVNLYELIILNQSPNYFKYFLSSSFFCHFPLYVCVVYGPNGL